MNVPPAFADPREGTKKLEARKRGKYMKRYDVLLSSNTTGTSRALLVSGEWRAQVVD